MQKVVSIEKDAMKLKTALLGKVVDYGTPKQIELTEESQYLSYHHRMYFESKEKHRQCRMRDSGIEGVRRQLSQNSINGVKLNFNIDPSLQRYSQFQCLLTLSKDFKYLSITNKKPKDIPIFG